jgi:beta-glucanase (GH16 family)
MEKQDTARWLCHYRLSKYHEDIGAYRGREAEFHERFQPYEVIEGEGNCLLNVGINEMWDLITGEVSGSGHIFDNAAAQIGVGDSSTAADPSQTDLQAATNETYKGMENGYPTSTNQKTTFKSSFGESEANYAWNEWVVKQATSGKCLNRKVESLGTKSSGTWTLEVSITLS